MTSFKNFLQESSALEHVKKMSVSSLIDMAQTTAHSHPDIEKLESAKDAEIDEVTTDDHNSPVAVIKFTKNGAPYKAWLTFSTSGDEVIDVDVEKDRYRDQR